MSIIPALPILSDTLTLAPACNIEIYVSLCSFCFISDAFVRQGKTETAVLALAKEHEAQLDACVVKPGLITAPNDFLKMAVACALWWTVSLPSIGVREISTAMLNQSLFGFEKDTLENDDLLRLGESEL